METIKTYIIVALFFATTTLFAFQKLDIKNFKEDIISTKSNKLNSRFAKIDSLKQQLDRIVNTFSVGRTRIAYTLYDCPSNKTISLHGNKIMHAASSFKTYLVAYCFYLVEQNKLVKNFLYENANIKETEAIINHIKRTKILNKKEKERDTRKFIAKFSRVDIVKMLILSDNDATTRIIGKLPHKLNGLNDFMRNKLGMKNSFIICWDKKHAKYFANNYKKIPLANGRHNTLTTNDQVKAWKKLFVEKTIIKDENLRKRLLELLMYSYYAPIKEGFKSKMIASKHGKIPYSAWGGSRPHSVLNDGGLIFNKDGNPLFIFQIQINDYPDITTGEMIIKKMAKTASSYLENN